MLFSVPTKLKSLTGNITVNETNSIELRCDVSGYPAPTVTWRKDGGCEQSTRSNILNKARSTRNDSGRYVCKAANSVGSAEMEMHILASIFQDGSNPFPVTRLPVLTSVIDSSRHTLLLPTLRSYGSRQVYIIGANMYACA